MEDQINNERSYIEIDAFFSTTAIKCVKELVEKRFENRLKSNFYYDFINWDKAENEMLLATFRAPDALPLFEIFDCVFNKNNPEEYVFQKCKLIHSLWNGWVPEGSISRGNNHVIALQFENTIPEIVYRLHEENQYRPTAPSDSFRLGLCFKSDFPMIAKNIKAHFDKKRNDETL